MSKTFTPWTSLVMVVRLLQAVEIVPFVFGISRLARTFSPSASKMALPRWPSLQTPSMSQPDLLIRAFVFGMQLLDILLSVSRVQMDTRIPFIRLPLHQMARILSLAVWTRLSRCGSSLHQEADTPTTLQRVDDASGLSRDTRYVHLPT